MQVQTHFFFFTYFWKLRGVCFLQLFDQSTPSFANLAFCKIKSWNTVILWFSRKCPIVPCHIMANMIFIYAELHIRCLFYQMVTFKMVWGMLQECLLSSWRQAFPLDGEFLPWWIHLGRPGHIPLLMPQLRVSLPWGGRWRVEIRKNWRGYLSVDWAWQEKGGGT